MLADTQNRPAAAGIDDSGEPVFGIADLAKEFRLSLRTLRFYESRGFLAPRRSGSERIYSRSDHDRIVLILQAKRLGFTLREIAELIAGHGEGSPALQLSRRQCTEQINLLERQKRELEVALGELRRVYSSHYEHELAGAKSQHG